MITVNLLPWRDEDRLTSQKNFITQVIAAALISLVIVIGIHFSISTKISYQQSRNQFITQRINELHQQIDEFQALEAEKKQLVNNLHLIQNLHNSRFNVVGFLDEIVRLTPPDVHLTRVDQKGSRIVLIGTATSNDDVTQLMKNIEDSKWMTLPVLNEIKIDEKDFGKRHFELEIQQKGSKLLTINESRGVK